MTPHDISRLGAYQRRVAQGLTLTPEAHADFEALKRQLLPEIADDPATLFVNEARSPNLDGFDYLEQQRQRDCDEFEAAALKFVEKYGRVLAEAAWQVVLTRR